MRLTARWQGIRAPAPGPDHLPHLALFASGGEVTGFEAAFARAEAGAERARSLGEDIDALTRAIDAMHADLNRDELVMADLIARRGDLGPAAVDGLDKLPDETPFAETPTGDVITLRDMFGKKRQRARRHLPAVRRNASARRPARSRAPRRTRPAAAHPAASSGDPDPDAHRRPAAADPHRTDRRTRVAGRVYTPALLVARVVSTTLSNVNAGPRARKGAPMAKANPKAEPASTLLDGKTFFTIKEIAAREQRSEMSVRRDIWQDRLRAVKIGRSVRVMAADLIAFEAALETAV